MQLRWYIREMRPKPHAILGEDIHTAYFVARYEGTAGWSRHVHKQIDKIWDLGEASEHDPNVLYEKIPGTNIQEPLSFCVSDETAEFLRKAALNVLRNESVDDRQPTLETFIHRGLKEYLRRRHNPNFQGRLHASLFRLAKLGQELPEPKRPSSSVRVKGSLTTKRTK